LTDLGSVLCALGQRAEATGYLRTSLELDPRQLHVWLNLAGLYHEQNEPDKAEHAFRAALDLCPHSAEASVGLGLLYIEQRLFDRAAHLLTEAVERGATTLAVYACLGQARYQLGDYANAASALERAALALPDSPQIVRRYAEARLIAITISGCADKAMETYASLAGHHAKTWMACAEKWSRCCASMDRRKLQSASARASSKARPMTRSSAITWTRCTGGSTRVRPITT
jgi:Tfp pilus assembly protein PilF